MRGIEAELDGGFIGGLSEVREEVTDLLLAGVDDLAGGGEVDGGGHILTKSLEAATQLFQEYVGGEGRFEGRGRFGGHGFSCSASGHRALPPRPSFLLKIGAPEKIATPIGSGAAGMCW